MSPEILGLTDDAHVRAVVVTHAQMIAFEASASSHPKHCLDKFVFCCCFSDGKVSAIFFMMKYNVYPMLPSKELA